MHVMPSQSGVLGVRATASEGAKSGPALSKNSEKKQRARVGPRPPYARLGRALPLYPHSPKLTSSCTMRPVDGGGGGRPTVCRPCSAAGASITNKWGAPQAEREASRALRTRRGVPRRARWGGRMRVRGWAVCAGLLCEERGRGRGEVVCVWGGWRARPVGGAPQASESEGRRGRRRTFQFSPRPSHLTHAPASASSSTTPAPSSSPPPRRRSSSISTLSRMAARRSTYG